MRRAFTLCSIAVHTIVIAGVFGVQSLAVGDLPAPHQPATGIDTVLFTGVGRWNGASGYTFEARATDAGEPGRGHDRFAITIRDATGQIVASVDDVLDIGNVDSLRIAR